jgi:ankyrin repeat protein
MLALSLAQRATSINTSRIYMDSYGRGIKYYCNSPFEKSFEKCMYIDQRILSGSNPKIESAFFNTLKKMADDGFNVNKPFPKNHRLPLHSAVSKNSFTISSALIAMGAMVNKYNQSHETPLFLAVFNDNIDIAKLVIDHGADVLQRNYSLTSQCYQAFYHCLPLHVARSPKMLHLLIKTGTPVNSVSNCQFCYTALHYNTTCIKVDSVRYLLLNNAEDIPNQRGATALSLAKKIYWNKTYLLDDKDLKDLEEIIFLLEQHHAVKKINPKKMYLT